MEHTDLPDVNSPLWRAVTGIGRGSGKMSTGRECDSRKTIRLPSLDLGAVGDIGQ
jgi:hypothetical protein